MSTTPNDVSEAGLGGSLSRERVLSLFAKRCVDVLGAFAGLLVLSPVLALIALVVLLDGGGPVLYRQERYGRGRKVFWIVKFRTLSAYDTTDGFRQVTANDDRVTRFGAFLRRYNLDELPQLWNVLRGDMSLVGPRPHPLLLDHRFEESIANYWSRYSVRPGMTGWAQVSGLRGPTDTAGAMAQRVAADLHYVENFSLWLDLRIIMLTIIPIPVSRIQF